MCGIAFAYRPDLDAERLVDAMDRAMNHLRHRGPDGQGRSGEFPWAMGHRRLAVIDPQGSAQPMTDATGRWWLSYNGELYNYAELRQGLAGRWRFTTQGDTEVILAGLTTVGTHFLDRMEGMWALALWDSRTETLLLVRDRMGQKPLYYQINGRLMACASELRALSPLSWFSWQEDWRSTADYLRYGYYLPGCTAFEQVHELLPGHWLRWSPNATSVQRAYWRLRPGRFNGTRSTAGERLDRVLTTSVGRRLVADVEVGALLSGGVDSSLMVGIVRRRMRRTLKTFTIGFDDPAFDERPHARRVARRFDSEHYEQRLSLSEGPALIEPLMQRMAQPFGDASLMPTALVSRLAASRVKVVLSGDGGDELFCGYHHYLARTLLRWYTRLPDSLKRMAGKAFGRFKPGTPLAGSGMGAWIGRLGDLLQRMEAESPYVAPVNYTVEDFKRLVPDIWCKGQRPPQLPLTTSLGDLRRMLVADALVYLPQDILTKVDRASMAFSLEVRSPFLDRQVVELAFDIPPSWNRRVWQGKRMLRRAFIDLLPPQVWQRRKQGFAVPLDRWFRSGLQTVLKDRLDQAAGPLNQRHVQRMIEAHVQRRYNCGHRLWQLYSYLQWRVTQPWLAS